MQFSPAMKAVPVASPANATLTESVPPHLFFLVSAVFHYLGPAFAVLLFAEIAPLGVAWLRIASAVVLGHRLAGAGGSQGIDRLGAAMLVAMAAAVPIGISDAMPAFLDPRLLLAAIGVGISSSVIPYVCDQLAMARLKRASFALLLALLPATASAIGILVLRQIPSLADIVGVGFVIARVARHRGEATYIAGIPLEAA